MACRAAASSKCLYLIAHTNDLNILFYLFLLIFTSRTSVRAELDQGAGESGAGKYKNKRAVSSPDSRSYGTYAPTQISLYHSSLHPLLLSLIAIVIQWRPPSQTTTGVSLITVAHKEIFQNVAGTRKHRLGTVQSASFTSNKSVSSTSPPCHL